MLSKCIKNLSNNQHNFTYYDYFAISFKTGNSSTVVWPCDDLKAKRHMSDVDDERQFTVDGVSVKYRWVIKQLFMAICCRCTYSFIRDFGLAKMQYLTISKCISSLSPLLNSLLLFFITSGLILGLGGIISGILGGGIIGSLGPRPPLPDMANGGMPPPIGGGSSGVLLMAVTPAGISISSTAGVNPNRLLRSSPLCGRLL